MMKMDKVPLHDTVLCSYTTVPTPEEGWPKGVLNAIEGPCMEFDTPNENGRIYTRDLALNRIINDPDTKRLMDNRALIMNGVHPADEMDITYVGAAGLVEALWLPEDDPEHMYGRFLVLDTPMGRIISTLIDVGSKIGVSARALGVGDKNADGYEVMDPDNYVFYTYDFVPEPGFASARVTPVNESKVRKSLSSYSEAELSMTKKLLESLNKDFFAPELQEVDNLLSKYPKNQLLESSQRRIVALEKALEGATEREKMLTKHSPTRLPKSVVDSIKGLQGQLADKDKEIQSQQETIDRLQRELDAARRENDNLSDTIDNYKRDLDHERDRYADLKQKLSEKDSKTATLEQKVRRAKNVSESMSRLHDELLSMKNENSELRSDLYEAQIAEISAMSGVPSDKVRKLVPKVEGSTVKLAQKVRKLCQVDTSMSGPVKVLSVSSESSDRGLERLIGAMKLK